MININNETFIYNYPFLVVDESHIVKLNVKLNKGNSDRLPKTFLIKFNENIPSNIDSNKQTLFNTFKIDNNFLKKISTKEVYSDHFEIMNGKQEAVYFENMCIFKTCTVTMLRYIIAYQLELNISNVVVVRTGFHSKNGTMCCNNEISLSKLNMPHYEIIKNITDTLMTYDSCISIGNERFIVFIINNNDNKLNNYEETFYKDYYQTAIYVKKILSNLNKQKINKYHFNINISQIVVTLGYEGREGSHSSINISKLFNIHHVGKFSKIYIHSNDIDSFQYNPRPMQYVKVNSSATNVFKGISSLYNTCALYWGLEIDKGLLLHHIEICSNMTINFIFTNINSLATYEELSSKLKTWITDNYISILKNINLSECIYNTKFNYNNYIPYFNGITASINVNNVTVSDIDALNEILLQENCKLKFRTRTSLQMNGYGFYTEGSKYKLLYLTDVHEFVTNNIIYKDMLPTIHVGLNGPNDLTVTIYDSYEYEELIFSFCYIIGIFNKLKVETNSIKPSELNIESIRKNSSRYGKKLLKILEKIDPRLFGPRKVGKKTRSFSGLCQKAKQRAVPITMNEYEYLRTIVPDSVVNLRNQTYPEQRLYLFCPYKKFSFLNYHFFPNQLCIIRCTTKPSNKTQYNYCASSLDAEYSSNIQNRYENQTITLYNPLITKGRKCKLPEELNNILVDYILLKLNITESIYKYCLTTYDKKPFIIKRDSNQQIYSILTEYNEEFDYVLILQSELNEDYFIFLNINNGEPLIFSKFEEIKKFFINNVSKTNSQYNFFNFLEKLFKTPLSQYYEKIIKDILDIIKTTFGIRYIIHNQFIRGIIWKDCMFLTPKFYWVFDESDITVMPLFKAIESVMNNALKFPSINLLDDEHIREIYKDYIDEKIHMVNFYGTSMLVEPFEISAKWNSKDIIIFDSNAILMNLYNINITRKEDTKNNQIKILNIADVIKNYLYIHMMRYNEINIENILNELKELNVVYEKSTFIAYTDNVYKTFVSWRRSKINENDFNDYINNYASLTFNDNIKSIYTKFQEELEFKVYQNEVIVSKIITS